MYNLAVRVIMFKLMQATDGDFDVIKALLTLFMECRLEYQDQ